MAARPTTRLDLGELLAAVAFVLGREGLVRQNTRLFSLFPPRLCSGTYELPISMTGFVIAAAPHQNQAAWYASLWLL
jgi:hypothetical protein